MPLNANVCTCVFAFVCVCVCHGSRLACVDFLLRYFLTKCVTLNCILEAICRSTRANQHFLLSTQGVSREEVKKANTEPSKVQPASAKTYLFHHSNVLNCKMANRQDNQVLIGGCPPVCYTEENLNHNLSTSVQQLSYSPVDWRLSVNWSTTQSSPKLLFSPHYSPWSVSWRIYQLLITPVTESNTRLRVKTQSSWGNCLQFHHAHYVVQLEPCKNHN